MAKNWFIAFNILLIAVAPTITFAEPSVSISDQYYEVEGLNAMGIYNQIRRKSEIRYEGKTFSGQAGWKITPRYRWDTIDGKCSMVWVNIRVDITITMPVWDSYRKVSRQWQQEWDRFYNALYAHEEHHKDLAIEGAKEMEHSLLRLSGFRDCESIKNAAISICNDYYKTITIRNKEYDKKTNHGQSEGAYLHRNWGRP